MDEGKKKQLYFIAIVLPDPHKLEAQRLKEQFRDVHGSKAALRSPPHLTLHMPFQWRADREQVLTEKLQDFFLTCAPVPVHLHGFGCFPPRVIFIDVQKTDALKELQQRLSRFCRMELNLFNANHKDNPFHPHVTLAFRDLRKKAFTVAWDEFKDREFSGEFLAEQIALLKHNGKAWEVFRTFDLQKQAT